LRIVPWIGIGRRSGGRYETGLLNSQWLCVEFYQLAGDDCYVTLGIFSQPGLDLSFHLVSVKDVNQICVCDVEGRIKTDINISEERIVSSREDDDANDLLLR
jgi:hypothetical protein